MSNTFDKQATKLNQIAELVYEYEETHREALRPYMDLLAARVEQEKLVKVEARKLAEVGTTKDLYDSDFLHVEVRANSPKLALNAVQAAKLLKKEDYEKVRSDEVDPKKWEQEKGSFALRTVRAVEQEGKGSEPAVSFRYPKSGME